VCQTLFGASLFSRHLQIPNPHIKSLYNILSCKYNTIFKLHLYLSKTTSSDQLRYLTDGKEDRLKSLRNKMCWTHFQWGTPYFPHIFSVMVNGPVLCGHQQRPRYVLQCGPVSELPQPLVTSLF